MCTSSSSLAAFLAWTPFDALHQCFSCLNLVYASHDDMWQIFQLFSDKVFNKCVKFQEIKGLNVILEVRVKKYNFSLWD
jgi:hypothetical protein